MKGRFDGFIQTRSGRREDGVAVAVHCVSNVFGALTLVRSSEILVPGSLLIVKLMFSC